MMTPNHSLISLALALGMSATASAQQPTPPQQPTPAPQAAAPAGALQQLAVPQRQVTLSEALRLGRQYNPTQVQAQQNIRIANMGVMQAWGAYLPSLSGTGSATRNSSQRVNQFGVAQSTGSLTDNSSFGLSANLTLFTGFQRGANRRAANATRDLNQAALLQQDYATDLSTKQAFFNSLATTELVGVAQANLARSDQQLKLTSEKLRLGATTRSDSLSASVDYGNAEVQLIRTYRHRCLDRVLRRAGFSQWSCVVCRRLRPREHPRISHAGRFAGRGPLDQKQRRIGHDRPARRASDHSHGSQRKPW